MKLKLNARLERLRTVSFDFFNETTVNLKWDSMASTFNANTYFNPENPDHVELFHPLHMHIATLEHNGQTLLTGYVLAQTFRSSPQKELLPIAGYSLSGVLNDSNIPTALYPLQNDGLSLREIAKKLLDYFKLSMVVHGVVAEDMDKVFGEITADENQSVQAYLSELATQRNIVITHDERGRVVFTRVVNKKPVIHFEGGNIPGVSFELTTNAQGMHSQIEVLGETDLDGGNAKQASIINPYIQYVDVPKVISQSTGDDVDTSSVAKAALAEELKNIKLVIAVDRWEIEEGIILTPGAFISVKNDELFLFKKTTWFVDEVTLTENEKGKTATITCVLPEVYNDNVPVNIFD